eukprot:GHVU01016536.1.p1 GENE.GHVU01016536.1~~GHVU01016536.1.p1  ORF type:complete len:192 (-),score=10.25 GHVU01016536.1:107-598(-)
MLYEYPVLLSGRGLSNLVAQNPYIIGLWFRLSNLPGACQSFALILSGMGFVPFIVTTFVGVWPWMIVYTLLGVAVDHTVEASRGNQEPQPIFVYVAMMTFVGTVIVSATSVTNMLDKSLAKCNSDTREGAEYPPPYLVVVTGSGPSVSILTDVATTSLQEASD